MEYISKIKDGLTGISRLLKDTEARKQLAEIQTKLNEVIQVVNTITGSDSNLVEDIRSIQTQLANLDNTYATDEDINRLTQAINNILVILDGDGEDMVGIVLEVEENSRIINEYSPALDYAESERQKSKNLYSGGDVIETSFKKITLAKPLKAGTYTISANVTSTDTTTDKCLINFNNESDTYIASLHASRINGYKGTFIINEPCYHIYFYASTNYVNSEGNSFSFTNIQLEEGSLATEYQEYHGEIVHEKQLKETFTVMENAMKVPTFINDGVEHTMNGYTTYCNSDKSFWYIKHPTGLKECGGFVTTSSEYPALAVDVSKVGFSGATYHVDAELLLNAQNVRGYFAKTFNKTTSSFTLYSSYMLATSAGELTTGYTAGTITFHAIGV